MEWNAALLINTVICWSASERAELQSFITVVYFGQTVLLLALTFGHITTEVYSTTKIFVDYFYLSAILTNHFSPNMESCIA